MLAPIKNCTVWVGAQSTLQPLGAPLIPIKSKPFMCYLIASATLDRTYIGVTNCLRRCVRQHNGEIWGGATYTRIGRPWVFVAHVSGFNTCRQAIQFEWAWKHCSRYLEFKIDTTIKLPASIQRQCGALSSLVKKERWTTNAPLASLVPLTVNVYNPMVYHLLLNENISPQYIFCNLLDL